MGLVNCERHGRSGIAINIQEEICKKIKLQEPLYDEDLAVITVKLYDNDEFLADVNYIVARSLMKELNLKEIYYIRNEVEDELLTKSFDSKMGAVCVQCLNNYKYKKNIGSTLLKYENRSSYTT